VQQKNEVLPCPFYEVIEWRCLDPWRWYERRYQIFLLSWNDQTIKCVRIESYVSQPSDIDYSSMFRNKGICRHSTSTDEELLVCKIQVVLGLYTESLQTCNEPRRSGIDVDIELLAVDYDSLRLLPCPISLCNFVKREATYNRGS
jgi:hypothetical protein